MSTQVVSSSESMQHVMESNEIIRNLGDISDTYGVYYVYLYTDVYIYDIYIYATPPGESTVFMWLLS